MLGPFFVAIVAEIVGAHIFLRFYKNWKERRTDVGGAKSRNRRQFYGARNTLTLRHLLGIFWNPI